MLRRRGVVVVVPPPSSSLNPPPFPPSSSPSSSPSGAGVGLGIGRRLSTLVRFVERTLAASSPSPRPPDGSQGDGPVEDEGDDEAERLSEFLLDLSSSFGRIGLLRGDLDRASSILSGREDSVRRRPIDSSGGGRARGGGRRKRRKGTGGGGAGGAASSSIRFIDGDGDAATGAAGSGGAREDESLILSSLGRIFHVADPDADRSSSSSSGRKRRTMPPIVIERASNAVTAASERAKSGLDGSGRGSTVSTAEHELIASAGPNLLAGLAKTSESLLLAAATTGEDRVEEAATASALSASLRAATSLVTLLGTRLSRAGQLQERLGSVGRSCAFGDPLERRDGGTVVDLDVDFDAFDLDEASETTVRRSGATLLACLPLAGGSDNAPPSKLRTSALRDASRALVFVVRSSLPSSAPSSAAAAAAPIVPDDDDDDGAGEPLDDFRRHLRRLRRSTERTGFDRRKRLASFRRRAEGLAFHLLALLRMEGHDARASSVLLSSTLPVSTLLDATEICLSYPIVAENRLYATRSRLRSTPGEGGSLSPIDAVEIGNRIKVLGLDLLRSILSVLGDPSTAAICGRRIVRIASTSLEESCSNALRGIVDPTFASALMAGAKKKKKPRRSHRSLAVRMACVEAFGEAIVRVGSNAVVVAPSSSSSGKSGGACRGAALAAGCLLVQLDFDTGGGASSAGAENGGADDEDWGTVGERVRLATAAAEALDSFLSTCGGYVPLPTRSFLDSVVRIALSSLASSYSRCDGGGDGSVVATPIVLRYASTKAAALRMGLSSVVAPWPDGAASDLLGVARKAATFAASDRDPIVASTARSVASTCDALSTPRAPPLVLVARGGGAGGGERGGGPTAGATSSGDALLDGIRYARRRARAEADAKTEAEEQEESKRKKRRKAGAANESTEEGAAAAAEDPERRKRATMVGRETKRPGGADGGTGADADDDDAAATTTTAPSTAAVATEPRRPVVDDDNDVPADDAGASTIASPARGGERRSIAAEEKREEEGTPAPPDDGRRRPEDGADDVLAESERPVVVVVGGGKGPSPDAEEGATREDDDADEGGERTKEDADECDDDEEEDSDDEDFPDIVDCDPDEDDL